MSQLVHVSVQVLSCLLSFPATHPALSAPLQRKALLAMLSAFSRQSALSAASASTPPQQNDGTFPSEPMLEDCPYIEQAVVPAFEAMAGLGHDSLLDRDTLPMLYDTAELNSASIAVSSPASVLDEGRGSKAPNDQQAGSVYVHRGQWRRTIALHALARIACTCSSLRQPILARLTEAIPAALAGEIPAAPRNDLMTGHLSLHFRLPCLLSICVLCKCFSQPCLAQPDIHELFNE